MLSLILFILGTILRGRYYQLSCANKETEIQRFLSDFPKIAQPLTPKFREIPIITAGFYTHSVELAD